MKSFKSIEVFFKPINEMRFTTQGDWFLRDETTYEIHICQMKDWRHMIAILFHELIEIFVCVRDGVTSKECDEFDAIWEKELRAGLHTLEDEAGCDRRAPYYKGHWWGMKMERLICFILGVNFSSYCRACNDIIVLCDTSS